MPKLVDGRTLEHWRSLDALAVLHGLGCYVKRDVTFHPVAAKKTARYHVNAGGREWELLITGSRFWDTRSRTGGGGAIDLAKHLFDLDFKRAVRMLRATFPDVETDADTARQRDASSSSRSDRPFERDDGAT